VVVDSHRYDSIQAILGRSVEVRVQDGKLINRVEFAVSNPLGRLAFDMAKGGFLRAQSVGFIPKEWQNGKEEGEPDRRYVRTELLEISLVAVPANPAAVVGLDPAIAELKEQIADLQKQLSAIAQAQAGATGLHDDVARILKPLQELNTLLMQNQN
jgi:HK97 family phage prohead protease